MNRTKKSLKNVIFGVVVQLLSTVISFITRTALIKVLGIEIVSLNGLFTEVVAMLSLAEMGVGTAIIFNLYSPIANNDFKKISQLMSLFKKAYRIIAIFTFFIGCLLIPLIPYIVTDLTLDIGYVRLVYFTFVCQTSASYLFSYKLSLLNADQKKYIVSIITLIVKIVCLGLSLFVIFCFQNYILYLIVNLASNVCINIIGSHVVDNEYPFLKNSQCGELSVTERKEVFSNIKNIFIKTLSGKITNSTDNILISTLVSTILVGYYSNYAMIFSVVKQVSSQMASGITGSIGNLMATESQKRCSDVLHRATFLFFTMALIMSVGIFSCCTQFIIMWIGEDYTLSYVVLCICSCVVFLEFASKPLWEFLTVSGLFEKDKNISIIGSLINLIVSVVLGLKIGIIGIFLGTICTYAIQIVLKIKLIYGAKFEQKPTKYYLLWIKMLVSLLLAFSIMSLIREYLILNNALLSFVVFGCISVMISLLIIFIIFGKSEEYKYAKDLLLNEKFFVSGTVKKQ